MTFFRKLGFVALLIGFSLGIAQGSSALAQDDGLIPAEGTVSVDAQLAYEEETHPPLRMTPDKSEILVFEETVGRVIIGNDAHLNIMMDSARRLIVVPRVPGATHFSVLSSDGKVLMQRHAIVAAPTEKYVRIRETCMAEAEGCMPVRMFYCPGMCHEVAIVGENNTSFSGSIAAVDDDKKDTKPTTPPPATGTDKPATPPTP